MKRFLLAAALAASLMPAIANAAGYTAASAPNGDDPPLELAIWYPSAAKSVDMHVGPFAMRVASDAPPLAGARPLIVMSHGTGGSNLGSNDTAIALADAGFVVVALMHAGDNYKDQSAAFSRRNFVARPRQVSRTIDFMTKQWGNGDRVDPNRVGVFGHSAGGATALLLAGGALDWSRVTARCAAVSGDWGCDQARKAGSVADTGPSAPVQARDSRVKAILLAAPALASGFAPHGTDPVGIPVSIWIGTGDTIVPDATLLPSLFGTRADYRLVPNAGHFAFLTPCSDWLKSLAPEICQDKAGFDRAAFLTGFQQDAIAFFKAALK
jgi:predicted dienelactone hydrolase